MIRALSAATLFTMVATTGAYGENVDRDNFYPVPRFERVLWALPSPTDNDIILTGDFNGDSFADIALIEPATKIVRIYLSNGRNAVSSPSETERWDTGDSPIEWNHLLPGDFDNDGRTDIAVRTRSEKAITLFLSRPPHSFLRKSLPTPADTGSTYQFVEHSRGTARDRVFLLDNVLTQFGRPGAIYGLDDNLEPDAPIELNIFNSASVVAAERWFAGREPYTMIQGDGYFRPEIIGPPWAELPAAVMGPPQLYDDFNGDGQVDILVFFPGIEGTWIVLANDLTGIELPVLSLPQRYKDDFQPTSGDFNGDGWSDVVIRRKNTLSLLLAVQAQDENTRRAPGANIAWGRATHGPYVCTGYSPNATFKKWGRLLLECPTNYAMVESDDSNFAWGLCCQLPEGDILTSEHLWTGNPACDPDAVVTGLSYDEPQTAEAKPPQRIRCTRIRTDRYALNPSVPGDYWGIGASSPTTHLGNTTSSLPLGIRGAVGRASYDRWDSDGCIGNPVGAILVTRPAGDCRNTRFSVISRKTSARGGSTEPLKMFPDCATDPNLFNPLAGYEISAAETSAGEDQAASR